MTLLHGFERVRAQDIPEINSHARIFRHQRTGAQLISLENEDSKQGLRHHLHHAAAGFQRPAAHPRTSVLCGSRKYPVKDPFIQLARGSLNTFLTP